MLNYIWLGMLVMGFVIGILNGRVEQVTKAAMDSSNNAVSFCIGLLGVLCLWSGLMNIAEKSGLVRVISKLAKPVLRRLFPDIPSRHPALGAMVLNLTANFLGLGNAATPLGIKAMHELQKLNHRKDTATDAMSMFLVLNASIITLVPSMVISVRVEAGSAKPGEIIGTIWVASACAFIAGIIATKALSIIWRNKP